MVNIPYQGAGSSLANTDFNVILDKIQSGLDVIQALNITVGSIGASGLLLNNGDAMNLRTATFNGVVDRGSISGTQTINFSSGLFQGCTVVSGINITWSAPVTGSMWRGTVFMIQDSTGSRLATWNKTEWSAGGSALGLSGGRMDVVTVMPSYRAGSFVASISTVF